MEVQRFEQAILKMAFETDARITTASVAYYLGIPSREANRLLNRLLEEGALELDSDSEGNLFYQVPNQGSLHTPTPRQTGDDSWQDLQAAADIAAGRAPAPSPTSPTDARAPATPPPLASPFSASLDDAADIPAFSPGAQAPHDHHALVHQERHTRHAGTEDRVLPGASPQLNYGIMSRKYAGPTLSHQQGYDGGLRHSAQPTRTATGCESASMIVDAQASCEPRPLANQRPTVVSCTGYETGSYATQPDHAPFGFAQPRVSTALATAGGSELALNHPGALDQPEHQPGMALLLSLILCGTGQIYNGEVSKGIIMMVLCILLWLVLLGWVVHIWSIVDAVVVAERINRQSNP
ncbi:hypothetical protein [Lujinxingia litoralis]|nr:hypothetical protein [Lujinxingia litoralis]